MKRTQLAMLTGLLLWLASGPLDAIRGDFRGTSAHAGRTDAEGVASHVPTPGEMLLAGLVAVGFMAARRLG